MEDLTEYTYRVNKVLTMVKTYQKECDIKTTDLAIFSLIRMMMEVIVLLEDGVETKFNSLNEYIVLLKLRWKNLETLMMRNNMIRLMSLPKNDAALMIYVEIKRLVHRSVGDDDNSLAFPDVDEALFI